MSGPEKNFQNRATLHVIARSRRRRSNLLEGIENADLYILRLLRSARNDLSVAVAVLEGVAAQLRPLPPRLNVRVFNYVF